MLKLLKYLLFILPLAIILSLTKCTPITPVHQQNVCKIFSQYPNWYRAAQQTQTRWGVPVSVQMAIIYQESHFKATAKPPRIMVMGIIPGRHITSAEGYAQALNATWARYKKATKNYYANREIFANASDFIGWYAYRAHHMLGIARNNARDLYLAYHEGISGYHERSYRHKYWLIHIANRVQRMAHLYHTQLTKCRRQLPKRHWWN